MLNIYFHSRRGRELDFPLRYADVKPEELHGCHGGYTRLMGTTLAPLSVQRRSLRMQSRPQWGGDGARLGGFNPADISLLLMRTVYTLLVYYFLGGKGVLDPPRGFLGL